MTPINNSDTAWLIVSDYNQDNDLPYEDLREDILNPEVDGWWWQHPSLVNFGVGVNLDIKFGVNFVGQSRLGGHADGGDRVGASGDGSRMSEHVGGFWFTHNQSFGSNVGGHAAY